MHYSCFDDAAGLYDYFVDGHQHPINADLPVPSFPSPTPIGVAAIEAGRPLPSSAVPAGRGWHARGQVVQCRRGGLSGIGDALSSGVWFAVGAVVLLVVGGYAYDRWGHRLPRGRR